MKYRNAAYLKEKNIHLDDITNERTNADIREEVKHISDSEVEDEYWEAGEDELQKKQIVDVEPDMNPVLNTDVVMAIAPKLEEYLRIHSINLTPKIRMYLDQKKKRGYMPINDQISGLGILDFERKKFLRTIHKVEQAFEMRLRDFNKVAKRKAKQGMFMITQ